MFSVKGKLYFVFANEQDVFFTDSMLRLNTLDYLWLMLRRSGHESICHITDAPDGLILRLPDRDTAELSPRPPWKPAEPCTLRMDPSKLHSWLRKSRKTAGTRARALIFQPAAFQKYLSYSAEVFYDYIQAQETCADTVILLLPMQLPQQEMQLFTSPQSVFAFQDHRGSCLSRPVFELIHGSGTAEIFDWLHGELGSTMLQLSAISHSQLCAMVRWTALRQGIELTKEQLWDYANFLYWYAYSPDLRAFTKEPISRYGTYRELSDFLLQPGGFDAIDERMAVLKKESESGLLADILNQICPLDKTEDRTRVQICHDNEVLRSISRMPFPVDFTQIDKRKDASSYSHQRWLEIQRWIMKPSRSAIDPDRLNTIRTFMEICRDSRLIGDLDTAVRAAKALTETAPELYTPGGSSARSDVYMRSLELSRHAFALQCSIAPSWNYHKGQSAESLGSQEVLLTMTNLLLRANDLLSKVDDAFLVPNIRFAPILRDISQLLEQMSPSEVPERRASASLTEEEHQRILLEFQNK